MPNSKGKTYKFYGKDGVEYPFYAVDEATAISYALRWSRRTGTKLYRGRKRG